MKILQIVGYVIASLGGGAVVVCGLAGWLGKIWAERMMKRMQADIDEALARANSALRIAERRHDVTYSTLHAKRAQLIADVYAHLSIVANRFSTLQFSLNARYQEGKGTQEKDEAPSPAALGAVLQTLNPADENTLEGLNASLAEIWKIVQPTRIYFRPDTMKLIDDLLRESRVAAYAYGETSAGVMEPLARALSWRRSFDAVQPLMTQLETEFRSLLGVGDKATIAD